MPEPHQVSDLQVRARRNAGRTSMRSAAWLYLCGNATTKKGPVSRALRWLHPRRSGAPGHHQLLDLGDGQRGVEPLRAGPRAVHDGVATVQLKRVFQVLQARTGVLVARVDDPAVGLQQDRRAQVTLAIPPVARAAGRAAGAQDALVQAVQLL